MPSDVAMMHGCSPAQYERLEQLCTFLETECQQVQIKHEHHIHAGVYSRTLYVPAGVCVVGLRIIKDTQLICTGDFTLTDGAHSERMQGFRILEGYAGRRAAVHAHADSTFTMLYATNAKTVEEAEDEFTDEPERLLTRKEKLLCQVEQSQRLPQ